MPLVSSLQQYLCHPRSLCSPGNYSPIHLPILVLGSANYLCYVPSSLSSPTFAAILLSLCLAVPCSAIVKSCALVLCTLQPTRPQWREQLLWQASMIPRLIQNEDQQTRKIQAGSVANRKTLRSEIR
jgi:hypothetical protein